MFKFNFLKKREKLVTAMVEEKTNWAAVKAEAQEYLNQSGYYQRRHSCNKPADIIILPAIKETTLEQSKLDARKYLEESGYYKGKCVRFEHALSSKSIDLRTQPRKAASLVAKPPIAPSQPNKRSSLSYSSNNDLGFEEYLPLAIETAIAAEFTVLDNL